MSEAPENSVDTQLALLQQEVSQLRQDIGALLEAWRAASGVLRFVKALGALAFAIASIWTLIRLSIHKSGLPHD